jgi:hypothetical protein
MMGIKKLRLVSFHMLRSPQATLSTQMLTLDLDFRLLTR